MTERQAYIAFNLTEKVGPATLTKLIASAGSAAAAWEAYPSKLARSGGEVDWVREEELAKKYGVTIVTAIDAEYPEVLKKETGSPLVLYVKGNVAALSQPSIAIVGTRRATQYGVGLAERFGEELARAGWMILSGLATGIDAAAHRGALTGDGITVGVLGSGLDRFYPEENRELAREIVRKGGAVVSEFPFGRPADTTTFPIRNHVVAALSRGVLAVECPLRSGTLITTGFAAELGRTVMAVPGRVDSRMSAGCLSLIREGATLVRNTDDVLEQMNGFGVGKKESSEDKDEEPKEESSRPRYTVEEALIMTHVDEDGISLDTLSREVHLPIEKVSSIAMGLRIKGFVRFLPGNRISLLTQRV